MRQNEKNRRALFALFAGVTGIGFAPVLVRLSEVGPSATASFRVLIALPFLWLLVLYEQRKPRPAQPQIRKHPWGLIVAAGLLFTGDLALWHWSLLLTTVANSTLFSNFAPLLVTIGAWLLFHERITPLFVAGLFVALAGAAMLLGLSHSFSERHFLGDMLAFSTAIFYAGYLLCLKFLRRHLSSPSIMAWTGLVCGPSFMVIALISGEKLLPSGPQGWLVLIALALISHLGGQTLIAYAFGHLPASFSALSLLLQPLVAAVLAWGVLGESLTPLQIIGSAVTLAGIGLAARATLGE